MKHHFYLRGIPAVALLLATAFLIGCYFYRPVSRIPPSKDPAALDSLYTRVFLFHHGSSVFLLNEMKIHPEREAISGKLAAVPVAHQSYLNAKNENYRYRNNAGLPPPVLQEVHLYGQLQQGATAGDAVEIPMRDITRMEVIERDMARSTGNTLLTIGGVTVGTFAVITAIILLTKESCPFISVYDGSEFRLQGETFGGAIYPSLAREDIVPLPDAAIGREVKVMISNELMERQFTDYATLLLIERKFDLPVAVSPDGAFYRVLQQWAPDKARLNNRTDMLQNLQRQDNMGCTFDDTADQTAVNRLELRFEKAVPQGKYALLLNLRNAPWLEYVFHAFTQRFGEHYDTWVEQQRQKPAADMVRWQQEQHIPLTIYQKTGQKWQELIKLPSVGPLMNREMVIPLEVTAATADVEVAFSTGFMFWELDRVQLAQVEMVPAEDIVAMCPKTAADEKGLDVSAALQNADGQYLEQLQAGNRAYITFRLPEFGPQKTYCAFLKTAGYYEPVRHFSGPADLNFLNRMKIPGAFTAFSADAYRALRQSAYVAVKN